ncbi:hypothetical protein [Streptomyces dysideae]|nr:hypothetical protein [Streptomyces dysideae]
MSNASPWTGRLFHARRSRTVPLPRAARLLFDTTGRAGGERVVRL